jgi:hypothetical protein
MKRIKLNNITNPNRQSIYTRNHTYGVQLAPGVNIKTANFKRAKRIQQLYEDLLNECLHEYNLLLSDFFVQYRNIWFFLEDKRQHKYYTTLETQFQNVISGCSRSMDRIASGPAMAYATFSAYSAMSETGQLLASGFSAMGEFLKKRSDWSGVARMKLQKERAQNILERVESFSSEFLPAEKSL